MFGSCQQIKWAYVKSISLFLKWNSESNGMFRYLIQNNPVPTLTKLIQNYNVTADNRWPLIGCLPDGDQHAGSAHHGAGKPPIADKLLCFSHLIFEK